MYAWNQGNIIKEYNFYFMKNIEAAGYFTR